VPGVLALPACGDLFKEGIGLGMLPERHCVGFGVGIKGVSWESPPDMSHNTVNMRVGQTREFSSIAGRPVYEEHRPADCPDLEGVREATSFTGTVLSYPPDRVRVELVECPCEMEGTEAIGDYVDLRFRNFGTGRYTFRVTALQEGRARLHLYGRFGSVDSTWDTLTIEIERLP
jgi:hypothetical protein